MSSTNPHSFRVAKLEILAAETSASLGQATGFFCEYEGRIYLVTNWHVVSGRHFQTGEALHRSRALPGRLVVHSHLARPDADQSTPSSSTSFGLPLYDAEQIPQWLEHPFFGERIDVVAIDMTPRFARSAALCRIDIADELNRQVDLAVMDQAFVTGYPLSATTTPNNLPIYKSGTIASEPQVFDSEPRIYIDGKTKTGMSGSPVMVRRALSSRGNVFTANDQSLAFVGIYSGRDRQERSEFEAELGIVWPFQYCLVPILQEHANLKTQRGKKEGSGTRG